MILTSDNIKKLKEQLRSIPNNGLGYGMLRYVSNQIIANENLHFRFNYLGNFDSICNSQYFSIQQEGSGFDTYKGNSQTCIADIIVLIINKRLVIEMTYDSGKFRKDIMKSIYNKYITQLRFLLEHCYNKEYTDYTPSDFDGANITQDEIDKILE